MQIVDMLNISVSVAQKRKGGDGSDAQSTDNRGPMGPVFSTYVYEEESGNEL